VNQKEIASGFDILEEISLPNLPLNKKKSSQYFPKYPNCLTISIATNMYHTG